MAVYKIYHKDGSILSDANGKEIEVHSIEYNGTWMGECFVTVTFENEAPISFSIGDYIEYRGERFEINYDPGKIKCASKDSYGGAFKYDSVKFNALSDELVRCDMLDLVLYDNKLHYTALPQFTFYVESLDDLLDRIQANLDELYGKASWKLYSRNKQRSIQRGGLESEWNSVYGEGTADNVIDSTSISISDQTCWDALSLVNSQFDVNFIIRNRNVYVGTAGMPTSNIFKYGKDKGLYEIEQNSESDQAIVTRLRAYGSNRNLPNHYYADLGSVPFLNITGDYHEGSTENGLSVMMEDSTYAGMFTDIISDNGTIKHCSIRGSIDGYEFDGTLELVKKNVTRSTTRLLAEGKEVSDAIKAKIDAGIVEVDFIRGANKAKFDGNRINYVSNLPNNMACDRLMLPGFPNKSLKEWWDAQSAEKKVWLNPSGKKHIFSNDIYRPYVDSLNIKKIGVRPSSVFFDQDDKVNGIVEIYPTIEEMEVDGVRIDEIYTGTNVEDDGRFGDDVSDIANVAIYLSPKINFDIRGLMQDDFTIHMKDGMCAGREFKVAGCTKQNDGSWKLMIERKPDDSLNLYFPYNDFQIKKGDHFVLSGIELPDAYVEAASEKLLRYCIAYLDKNDYTRYVYQPKVDEIFMARQHDTAMADASGLTKSLYLTLKEGDIMLFKDDDLGIDAEITIDQLTIKEEDGKIPTYEITLREEKEVGTIQKIQNQISSITNGNGGSFTGGTGGGGLSSSQIKNLIDAIGSDRFLSKLNPDTAAGIITFLQGLISKGKVRAEEGVVIGQFVQGFLGTGGNVDAKGNAEFESIFARSFISTPELRYNRITVTDGELWITNGNGIIESIDTENMIITLHLEENDFASVAEGDLCRGIYNNFGTTGEYQNFITLDADDCGFPVKAGFFTSYFRVAEILEQSKGKCSFRYELRNSSTPHPCAQMKFAQYGNDIDETRQASAFISSVGHFYFESIEHVNTWAIQQENITIRWGWVDGFVVKNNDGTTSLLRNYGLYVPDNIYFGNAVVQLDPKTIDSLRKEMEQYSIELSNYTDVITVDDAGNVIDGLYKLAVEGDLTTKYDYRIAPAVFVKKGNEYLIEADSGDDAAEGTYKMYVTPKNCTAEIINGTVCVTAIDNIKDGVSGTSDDVDFDYDAMRKMESISVVISVMCEGIGSITKEFKVAIKHDSKPYISMTMDNQNASVSWNTKAQKYIGLPYSFNITAARANDLTPISEVSVVAPEGVTVTSEIKKGVAVLSVTSLPQTLGNVTDIKVTATITYAGISYEQTLVHTLNRYEDVNVYELKPSVTQVVASVNTSGEKVADVEKVTCSVLCSSSDDKQYILTAEQMTTVKAVVKYSIDDSTTLSEYPADGLSVSPEWSKIVFHLLIDGSEIDSQDVPVMLNGVDGEGIEYVFLLTTNDKAPTIYDDSSTEAFQSPDYCPYTDAAHTRQWTDEPTGVGINNRYEWVAQRKKQYGKWLPFSEAKKWTIHAMDGTSPYSLDLTNESSQVLCDQDGNVIGGYETTTIQLFHGASVMSISDFTITITATNISYSLSGAVITPSAFVSGKDSAQIAVKAILKTNTSIVLTAVYSITKNKAGKDGVIYSLQPSVSTFSKDSNGDWVTKSFHLYVKKTTGTGATEITTLTALNAEGLTLKYGSTTVASSTLELVPSTICGSNTYADLYLYKGGVVIDRERINVVSDGTSPYVIDLTNENSSVLVSDTGAAISAYEQTSLVIYRGTNNVTSSFSVTFTADGITCTETSDKYTYSFSAITKDLANVTFTATNGSVTLKAIYTVTRIKNGAIYSLICSHDTIHLDNTGNPVSTDKTMYLSIRKTTPEGDTTSTSVTEWKKWGVNVYYLNSGGAYTAFATSNDISYSTAFASRTYASFQIRKTSDGTTILDSERVNAVSDGKPGPQGNPGPNGDDAVNYSLVPNMTTISVDGEGKVLSTGSLVITLKKSVGASVSDSSDYNIFTYYVYNDGNKSIFGSLNGFSSPASITLNGSVAENLVGYYFEVRNSLGILAALSIPLVRQGKPSFSLVDRGLWIPDGSYSYKYDNGILVRDMVKYPKDGIYYYYMVAKRTDLTGTNVPVTGSAQSPSNTDYWEQGSKYNLLVADVVYADNATLGGFHINQDSLWAGGSTLKDATVLLDGKNGTARVTGEVNATSGNFEYCNIGKGCTIKNDNGWNLESDSTGNGWKLDGVGNMTIEFYLRYRTSGSDINKLYMCNGAEGQYMFQLNGSRGVFINAPDAMSVTGNSTFNGNTYLNGNITSMTGVRISTYKMSSSGTIPSSADLVTFTNSSSITVGLPPASGCKGKVLYLKKLGSGSVTLSGSSSNLIVGAGGTSTSTTTEHVGSSKSMMYISDGTYWIEFYCG